MSCRVIWSPEAAEDLESISEYIARDSRFYARVVVAKILKTTRTLSDHPLMGRVVPEFATSNIRERFIYNYRIIYQVDNNEQIIIVAIIHGARDLAPDFNRDEGDNT